MVELGIYNIQGQLIKTLLLANQSAGNYKLNWNAKDNQGLDVPSGLYLCKMKTDKFIQTKKLLYLK